ncbi:MAG: glycosyltransferase [Bacillota bacterium]|nr:glycosyltransferase [Bacillota bacterium]
MMDYIEGLVSIVMPTYNCGKYILDSIDSVLAQTYTNWELIIIDDCSTDNTKEIVDCVIKENLNKSIAVYQNETNKGVSFSRNYAVSKARGEYIAFLDSDDMWMPDKLQKQVDVAILNPNIPIIFTATAYIKENGERFDYVLNVPNEIFRDKLLEQNIISCSSVLVRHECLLSNKMPEVAGLIHEDFATWINILSDGSCACGINEPLLLYRVRETSKSSSKAKAAIMNWNTYRYCNIPVTKAIGYMFKYATNGFKKYAHLHD